LAKIKKKNPSCWNSGGFIPACAGHGKRGKKKKKPSKKRCKLGKVKSGPRKGKCRQRKPTR